jgi:serine/threonine protein kinase
MPDLPSARQGDGWTEFGEVARFATAEPTRRLGRGTFKRVVVVRPDGPGGREYAMAHYGPQEEWLEDQFSGRERFCREVRAMRTLAQTNVMPVVAADLRGKSPWFVMPLADANLEGMPKLVTDRAAVVEVFRQVLDAVASMHANDFIHRDLKGNNIFRVDGRWVVSDLGLLRDFRTLSTTVGDAKLAGSNRPPELHMSLRDATSASDVFALGFLVRQMLPSVERVFTGISNPFAFLPATADLRPVIAKCLQPEPADRYPDAVALRPDLLKALGSWASTLDRMT